MLRGWPRRMRNAFGSRAARRRIGAVRSGFIATPAIGNIAGSRKPEVVAAGLDGRVYAWNRRGRRVRGFPVAIDARRPPANGRQDYAIYASPALADLNGDGRLDIVVGACHSIVSVSHVRSQSAVMCPANASHARTPLFNASSAWFLNVTMSSWSNERRSSAGYSRIITR